MPLIPLAATLVAVSLGLAACGGSSSTSTQTSSNAAATGKTTTGTTSSGTTSSGTTSSGTSSTGTSSTATTPTGHPNPTHFTAVRECLAKKGITLPHRVPGGLLGGSQLPKGMTRAQLAEALKGCGAANPNGARGSRSGFHNSFNSPRFRQVLLRFAACLRQNGINVGEPNTSGKGPIFKPKAFNTGSPQFKAAAVKCRSTLLGALRPKASPGAATG